MVQQEIDTASLETDLSTEAPGLSAPSQIGPFDYVPKLGFREYWYPAVEARKVGRRPLALQMLGDDLVLFRDGAGRVAVLEDWCPHRGARLSLGACEFKGTITCPYHGYTFDGTGQCVAGLIDGPDSPLVPKLRDRRYPTAERMGVVFVWMGQTDPVPVEEDIPDELLDPDLTGRRYMRTKVWETNWTEPVNQGIDFHEFYLHRQLDIWRLLNYRLPFFRPKMVSTGGVKLVEAGDDYIHAASAQPRSGQLLFPGLGARWPRHVWWRRLPAGRGFGGRPLVSYNHSAELPSKIRTILGGSIHLRWMVPITEEQTRVWTFTIVRKPRTVLGALFQALWYYGYRRPNIVISTNEQEDLVVFQSGRLNLDKPQKLGPLDTAVIYFRRHLALQARDYQRLSAVPGTLKPRPDR